jgi:hypothetical protein
MFDLVGDSLRVVAIAARYVESSGASYGITPERFSGNRIMPLIEAVHLCPLPCAAFKGVFRVFEGSATLAMIP